MDDRRVLLERLVHRFTDRAHEIGLRFEVRAVRHGDEPRIAAIDESDADAIEMQRRGHFAGERGGGDAESLMGNNGRVELQDCCRIEW